MLNLAWDSSGSSLEGSGTLLGVSWALLGQLWGTLGRLLVSLGRLLGPSWPLPGRSWASPGQPEAPFGSILAPRAAPGLDFGRFGSVLGFVLKGFGDMFWHAFACSTHFVTLCFYLCNNHAFAITCAFSSPLQVRRSVRSTWNYKICPPADEDRDTLEPPFSLFGRSGTPNFALRASPDLS